jgi:hypothetical protein
MSFFFDGLLMGRIEGEDHLIEIRVGWHGPSPWFGTEM